MKIYFILNKFLVVFKKSNFLVKIIHLLVLFYMNLILFYIKNTI